jgi:hypothetical protein
MQPHLRMAFLSACCLPISCRKGLSFDAFLSSHQDIDPGAAAAAGVSRTWPQSAAALPAADDFDWQGDQPLHLPQARRQFVLS